MVQYSGTIVVQLVVQLVQLWVRLYGTLHMIGGAYVLVLWCGHNVICSMHCEAQRTKYIDQRKANPSLRMRSDSSLGPRTTVTATQRRRSSLEKPEMFWVELSTYQKDHPEKTVNESDIVWENVDGIWKQGVTCMIEEFCFKVLLLVQL